MSDLVETVARAIATEAGEEPDMVFSGDKDPVWKEYDVHSRAAIKAVVEHIEAQCAHGSNTWFVAQRLRAQLKEGSE